MPPAIIVAGVTAAAAVGGSVLSAKAQKKAANQASETAQQTADTNNALTEKIYNQNYQTLTPYAQRGNAAGNAINSLLGLGMPQNQGGPENVMAAQSAPNSGVNSYNPAYGISNINGTLTQEGPDYGGVMGQGFNGYPGFQVNQPQGGQTYGDGTTVNGAMSATSQTPQQDYNQAFQNYQNSTGYQFRRQEGLDSLDSKYSKIGAFRSGAAIKAREEFGQNIGSQEYGNYLGQLGQQQNVGLAGASAIAGVGQNMVNNVTANNNSAGTVAANAALAKGQTKTDMYGGIASGIGNFLGSSF